MSSSTSDNPATTTPSDRTFRLAFFRHAFPMALSTVEDGRYVEISDAFCAIIGYTRNEAIGKTSRELGIWVDPKQRDSLAAEMAAGNRVRDHRVDFRTRTGEVRQGLFSIDIIEVDGHRQLLTVMNDITDRLRAEEERQISDTRYRLVCELTSDYAYSFKADAEAGLVLEWLSGAIEKITGFDLSEIQAQGGWESLIHPDDLEIPRGQLAALLEGRTETVEYRMVTRSQETRWIRDYARPAFDPQSGKLTHIHGAVQDITEQKLELERRLQLEAQVQQSQKLESLGVLAGGIAHDFNNILMAIVGHIDLIGDDLPATSPSLPSIEAIRRASGRATELIRQLLVYAGKGRSRYERVDLRGLVGEMAELLEVSISKKIELELDFAEDLPAVTVDPVQVRQVCMNLVINASEAIGESHGRITLRTGRESLAAADEGESTSGPKLPAGEYIYMEVEDTGPGMDSEVSAKIFEPFYTTKFDGRGLGLAAVQGIVHGHRGAITVLSKVGEGSTIRAYFPVTDIAEPEPASAATTASVRQFDGRNILLVDDEESVRDIGRRLLERLGWHVVTACDGEDALARLRDPDVRFDAVLMDLTMPRLGGAECMPELRRLRPDLPVVFASGYGQQDLVDSCGGWPHTGFIAKPFDRKLLAEQLARVLAV